jgi:hypothetical protein
MIPALMIAAFMLWRLRFWDEAFADLMEPDDGTPYQRAVIGGGHALVGAAIVAALPDAWIAAVAARAIIGAAYWMIKEAGDLKRGGDLRDGFEDAAFVWLGAYYGPWWWPLLVLGAMGCVMLTGRRG